MMRVWAVTLVLMVGIGCASRDDTCAGQVEAVPPSTIVVTGASSKAVPYASWGCHGYDAEGDAGEVAIAPGPSGSIEIDAGPLGPSPSIEDRVRTGDESERSFSFDADGPWAIVVTEDAGIVVRPCTSNDRCAYLFDVATPSS